MQRFFFQSKIQLSITTIFFNINLNYIKYRDPFKKTKKKKKSTIIEIPIHLDGSKPASINERPILYRFHQLYTHGHKDIEIHNADKFHFSIVPKDLSLCEIVIDFSIRLSPRFLAYHARRKSIKRIPGTTNFQASILILPRTHTYKYIYIYKR